MYSKLQNIITQQLAEIKAAGLWKEEWPISSPQSAQIQVAQGEVINFCANNYLGLANHPKLIAAASRALEQFGLGTASVRFICGTFTLHEELEKALTQFLQTEDTILYSSCFEANTGLFETLLGEEDAIVSDQLNHASIIDGVRLCKAKRYRYRNSDMNDLETQLRQARSEGARVLMIATDGVFSMDGSIAKLAEIAELAQKYEAVFMVDDSHATGFMGAGGRGTPEHCGVMKKVDIITSTMGKALGGAAGGFTSGKKEIVQLLRQRSRPYLFSNALPPMICASTLQALQLVQHDKTLREKLHRNTQCFRAGLKQAGLHILDGSHPIVPVMFGDANLASAVAQALLQEGVYVKGFSYPVVPQGEARIRCQVSAAHTQAQLECTIAAFAKVVKK